MKIGEKYHSSLVFVSELVNLTQAHIIEYFHIIEKDSAPGLEVKILPAVFSGRFFAKINSSKKPPYSFKMDGSGNLCNQACRGKFGLQTTRIRISRSVFFKWKGGKVDEKSCLPNGADLLTV